MATKIIANERPDTRYSSQRQLLRNERVVDEVGERRHRSSTEHRRAYTTALTVAIARCRTPDDVGCRVDGRDRAAAVGAASQSRRDQRGNADDVLLVRWRPLSRQEHPVHTTSLPRRA